MTSNPPTVNDLIRQLMVYNPDQIVLSATVKIKHRNGSGSSTLIMRRPPKDSPKPPVVRR